MLANAGEAGRREYVNGSEMCADERLGCSELEPPASPVDEEE